MANVNDMEKLKRKRRRSPFVVLIVCGVLALVVLVLGISSGSTAETLPAFLVISAAGVGLFCLIRHAIKREDEKDIPGTAYWRQGQEQLKKTMEKKRAALYTHRSLHDEMNFRNMIISGAVLGGMLLLTLIIWLLGYYSVYLFIADAGVLVCFIFCLSGSSYKKLIRNAAVYGETEQSLSEDFSKAAFVRGDGGSISLSEKYLMSGSQHILIPCDEIVWAFGRCRYVYMYQNGVYTGRREEYYLVAARKNGELTSLRCDNAGVRLMLELLSSRGCPVGYSYELFELYSRNMDEFAQHYKEFDVSAEDFLIPEN